LSDVECAESFLVKIESGVNFIIFLDVLCRNLRRWIAQKAGAAAAAAAAAAAVSDTQQAQHLHQVRYNCYLANYVSQT